MTTLQMSDQQITELDSDIDDLQSRVFNGDTTGSQGFVRRMTIIAEEHNITFSELRIRFALRLKLRHQEGWINDEQLAGVPDGLRTYFQPTS